MQTARRGRGRPPGGEASQTRERIVCAAIDVFSELGYEAATLQAIADRAELTRPAINHYFSNKRLLYAEVLQRMTAVVVTEGAQRARNASPTLAARIGAFIDSAVQVDRDDSSAAAFMVTAVLDSRRHPELRQLAGDPLEGTRQFLSWAVDDAIASGELAADTDAEAVIEMLVALLWGLGFYAGFVGDHHQLERITGQLGRLLEIRPWERRS